MSLNPSATISHLKRHLDSCTRRKIEVNIQKTLNYQPDGSNVEVDLVGAPLLAQVSEDLLENMINTR